MADVKRTRVFVEASGVTVTEEGEFKDMVVRLTGNFRSKKAAKKAVRRKFPDFLPSDIAVKMVTYRMDEDAFYANAVGGDESTVSLPEE